MTNGFSRFAAALAILLPVAADAQDVPDSRESFFGPLAEPFQTLLANANPLPWLAGCIAVIAVVLLIGQRLRLSRRASRIAITGLKNGPRFRVVDAMCHAVWKSRKIDEARLKRALEIARDTTDMDFKKDHLREVAMRVDRLIIPTNFYWMRDGLTTPERMVIFNATVSVLLADGPLLRSDRAFLRTLARGLRLRRKELRDLAHLVGR